MGFARGFEVYRHLTKVDDFALVDTLIRELDAAGERRPVFAYLHLLDVHWPYDEVLADLPLDAFGALADDDRLHEDRTAVRRSRRHGFRDADALTVGARYDHGVAWTDRAVGRLVDGLRARGRWERTCFVVTSDHGEGLLERGHLEHTYAPYQEVSAIPLVVRVPPGSGVAPGQRRSVVSLVDVGPTLVELAGLPAWKEVSGKSFAGILAGVEDARRAALIETDKTRALRTATGKLIVPRGRALEFYDLASDPLEQRNLAVPACAGPCREHLARLRRLDDGLREPALAEGAGIRYAQEDVEELRALGYL
jgi:arylsulfatase A-like enzyme